MGVEVRLLSPQQAARARSVAQPLEPLGIEAPDPVVELALAQREQPRGLRRRVAERQVPQRQDPTAHPPLPLMPGCRFELRRVPAPSQSHYVV